MNGEPVVCDTNVAVVANGDAPQYQNNDPDDDVGVFHNWTQFLPEINVSVKMHD